MGLFRADAELKILILWAAVPLVAKALQAQLTAASPAGYDFKTILESEEPRFNAASKAAIDEADCILMVAAEADWAKAPSAVLEWEYFYRKVLDGERTRNQLRFVRAADRECPRFEVGNSRRLSFKDPDHPDGREIRRALEYLAEMKRKKDGLPPGSALTAQRVGRPEGVLAATLWVTTLDEAMLEISEDGQGFQLPPQALTAGLKHLKALHSIHSGLGAILERPIKSMIESAPEPGIGDMERLRAKVASAFGPYRPPFEPRLQEQLQNCIGEGLLPFLEGLADRLANVANASEAGLFVQAAIDRLRDVLKQSGEVDPALGQRDGTWWVDGYLSCLDLLQTSFPLLVSSAEFSQILSSNPPADSALSILRGTFEDARNLHVSNLQLTYLLVVIFSFLHAHRARPLDGLMPAGVETALQQVESDWENGRPTDAVVKWSNQMMLRQLAAAERYEGLIHAAA